MEFLSVGLDERFSPPIQVSVVDVKNWQMRDAHNELEAEQVRVSSLIVLTHLERVSKNRVAQVEAQIRETNPMALIATQAELDVLLLRKLGPIECSTTTLAHHKTHGASCSVDL